MRKHFDTVLLASVYGVAATSWVVLTIATRHTPHTGGLYFQIPLTIIPLLGGFFGLRAARMWGGWLSVIGRAAGGLALGLLAWGGGMVIWNYYIFFTNVEVPYPSLADAIFILSWPLWIYGVIELSKAIGVKFGMKAPSGKWIILVGSPILIAASYYLIVQVARGGAIDFNAEALKLFFDLFYPLGSIVLFTLVAIVFLLSRQYLGGKYKNPILILFLGFFINYLSDFTFSYTTTQETYFNGHFVDFVFLTAMFVLSLAVNHLRPDGE